MTHQGRKNTGNCLRSPNASHERRSNSKAFNELGYLQKCFFHLFPNGELKDQTIGRGRYLLYWLPSSSILQVSLAADSSRNQILQFVLLDLKSKAQVRQMTSFFMKSNPEEALLRQGSC
ncbi:MAG: hypothetical protein MHMPM18_002744 [Marteilia pararefringens]